MDYSNLFVCLMGMGTVFLGLICLIALTRLMSLFLGRQAPDSDASQPPPAAPETDQQALIAAVSAAIAEDLGTDITGIRILSMKKL